MNYKNRRPKSYVGCCPQCAGRKTDGFRCCRRLTVQELRARDSAQEQLRNAVPVQDEP